jgi:hypothetical protein
VDFLSRFKAFASEHGLSVFERENYKTTLNELGILPSQAREVILGLTIENYYKGIGLGDRDGEEVCEFGTFQSDRELYIKLIIDNLHHQAICFSFHFAERDIVHPFATEDVA